MKIYHSQTCLPDYFSGSSKPVVQVAVENDSTYGYIKNALLSDYCTEHLEFLWNDAEANNEYISAVEELFDGINLDRIPDCCRYIEPANDDYDYIDSVYMYFIIDTEE